MLGLRQHLSTATPRRAPAPRRQDSRCCMPGNHQDPLCGLCRRHPIRPLRPALQEREVGELLARYCPQAPSQFKAAFVLRRRSRHCTAILPLAVGDQQGLPWCARRATTAPGLHMHCCAMPEPQRRMTCWSYLKRSPSGGSGWPGSAASVSCQPQEHLNKFSTMLSFHCWLENLAGCRPVHIALLPTSGL